MTHAELSTQTAAGWPVIDLAGIHSQLTHLQLSGTLLMFPNSCPPLTLNNRRGSPNVSRRNQSICSQMRNYVRIHSLEGVDEHEAQSSASSYQAFKSQMEGEGSLPRPTFLTSCAPKGNDDRKSGDRRIQRFASSWAATIRQRRQKHFGKNITGTNPCAKLYSLLSPWPPSPPTLSRRLTLRTIPAPASQAGQGKYTWRMRRAASTQPCCAMLRAAGRTSRGTMSSLLGDVGHRAPCRPRLTRKPEASPGSPSRFAVGSPTFASRWNFDQTAAC